MSLYALLSSEERSSLSNYSDFTRKLQEDDAAWSVATKQSSLDIWTSENSELYRAVIEGRASPLTRNLKRFKFACSICEWTFDDDGHDWHHRRCKSCDRRRSIHRVTAGYISAFSYLRRNNVRVRMVTLTLPSVTFWKNQPAWFFQKEQFGRAKEVLRRAMRTAEWRTHVTGYLWSFECPLRWHPVTKGLLERLRLNRGMAIANPHFHILITGDYWPQADLSRWAKAAGFGEVTDIRAVRDSKGVRYAMKRTVTYASKEHIPATATRQSGGVVRSANRLCKWLWKNRRREPTVPT